ncbi:hypothetical protein ACWC5I_48305 [Kitasatospora sp. NPDC001574]
MIRSRLSPDSAVLNGGSVALTAVRLTTAVISGISRTLNRT